MATCFDIGAIDQIPIGEGRNFRLADRTVAVFRTHDDAVFATQPDCPHRQGPLADGLLGGTTIICPLHDRAYDLRTGKSATGECPLKIYPVSVTDDRHVCVTVE